MANDSLAQRFVGTYSGNHRIGKNQGKLAQAENAQPFGKSVTVFRQKPKIKRPELAAWFEADDIESLNRPIYEAKRMIGDTLTVCHIDYSPTAAMTPRWEAYGTAYGVSFILTLWQQDVSFINTVTGAVISKADYTPAKPLEIVVKRFDAKRGLVGAMAVFHEHKAVFVGEEAPTPRKFQPSPKKAWKVWAESPFKTVR